MSFDGTANSEQLSDLARVLGNYCRHANVEDRNPARERLARRITTLFNDGIRTPEEITRVLDAHAGVWQVEGMLSAL
jgi:hypothetical protein